MNNQKVPLRFIMEVLNISGQYLADQLTVSRSLISKWKNGKLPFNPAIYHFDNVVNALLSINNQQNSKTLERFFNNIIPDIIKNEENWLENSLRQWLAGNIEYPKHTSINQNTSLYDATVKIYSGNEGKRQAVSEFLDFALTLPAGQEILYSDMEDMSWLVENKAFLDYWKTIMTELLKKGHKVHIIHNTGRDISSISNIVLNWLPLYFTGNLHSHYYQNYDYNIIAPSVYIIKDHKVALSFNATKNQSERYTAVYSDPLSVIQMENIYKSRLNASEKLVDMYEFTHNSISKLRKRIAILGKKQDDVYLATPIPVFTTMTRQTLIEVLLENKVNSELTKKILTTHRNIQSFFLMDIKNYFTRQIYDLDRLKKLRNEENIMYLELSSIALAPIMVSKKHFREHIKNLIALMELSENVEVALIPYDQSMLVDKTSIWVKRNCFIYAYPQYEAKALALSAEPMVVYSFFEQMEAIWNHLSIINKDQHHVIMQLKKLCE